MEPHLLIRVKASLARYLSDPRWNWNWVVTQTFDPSIPSLTYFHSTANERRFRSGLVDQSFLAFLTEIADSALVCYGFCFGEQHKSGAPHWHALVHVKEDIFGRPRRRQLWGHMKENYGRNRIEPYLSADLTGRVHNVQDHVITGIASYLTKYVAKEAYRDEATWDFRGFIGTGEAQPGEICDLVGIKSSDFSLF